jgi:DNA transformation protein
MITPNHKQNHPIQLEDLPNIGKSIATDLRRIGIFSPSQFAEHEPLALYLKLADVMGHRHDPCVLYTFISVKHFLENGEAHPWWKFTEEGKSLLEALKKQ